MKYIYPILIALLILPTITMGASIWSQQNVKNTYEGMINDIDTELRVLSNKENVILITYGTEYSVEVNGQYMYLLDIREQKAKLHEEKRILEVAYTLINNSFNE